MSSTKARSFGGWRTASLVGIHVLFIAHFVHWKLRGRTLAPLEFNEVMYTIHQGIVTAGFILMALVMLATLVFGRFFCSWGCHILALQDACGWIMDKLRIKRQPIRSRTLIWLPLAVMFYLFIWPQLLSAFHGIGAPEMAVVEAGGSRWSSFTTDNFWRNLPPPGIAVLTFFICGFVIVYLLGSRGFCFQACPYGALFGIADQFAPGRIALKVATDCTACGLCTKACTSDILVHKELAEHGMVTNPRCLKDLDCIAACPEEAITYGFRKPPLFRKGHPLGASSGRFSFTWREDLFMLFTFLVSVFVFRGLYDAVPFLLAVGLAVCTAYLLLLGWRSIRSSALQLRGVVLKANGRLQPAGHVFRVLVLATLLVLAHSAVVQFHVWKGRSVFKQLGMATTIGTMDRGLLKEGIAHYEKALAIGMVAPIDERKELSNLHLLAGDAPRARTLLQGIVEQDPAHVEARYRLGEMAMSAGDKVQALEHWRTALALGVARPHSRDEELLGSAALHVGSELAATGDAESARREFNTAIEALPNDPRPLLAMSALEHAAGQEGAAVQYLERALGKGADEAMVRNNLGAILLRQGRWDEAMVQYARLTQLRPDDANVFYTLGVAQARTGDSIAARTSLLRALALEPGHARAAMALSKLDEQATPSGLALNQP